MFLITGNNHELLRVSIKSVFLLLLLTEDCLYILDPSSFVRNTVLFYLLAFWALQLPAVNIKINFLGVKEIS